MGKEDPICEIDYEEYDGGTNVEKDCKNLVLLWQD